MHKQKQVLFILIGLSLLTACNNSYKFKLTSPKKAILNEVVTATLTEVNGKPIDSVQFFINGKQLASNSNTASIKTAHLGVGKYAITALAFYPNKTKTIHNTLEVFANKSYDVYTYKIVNTYPHDKGAYTQGLEYHNGFLYESTGRHGTSSIRKVEIKTGKVLQKITLDKKYFGEGMTIFNNKLYLLTWQAKMGFIYNVDTFKKEGQFSYGNSQEGWGLTHNGTELIKSDGTSKIWFLDPKNLQEKHNITVYTDKTEIKDLNELEYIKGKIYVNYWKQPLIAMIDPKTGIVEGIANLTSLQDQITKEENLTDQDDVLNGIAYDEKNDRIFVTGKNWGKLYEIKFIKK